LPVNHRGLTPRQKDELWARWKEGQSLSDIAEALGKSAGSVYTWLLNDGGFPPTARKRSENHLNAFEREEISRGLVTGMSVRALAQQLGRSPSTVSREIARNGGRQCYRAGAAEERAAELGKRPKACLFATNKPLRNIVARKLQENWSPQQIAGWLRIAHHNDCTMQVSHETIYRSLFIQARGVLKKELVSHLRSRRLMRRAKGATNKLGNIPEGVSIRERPAEVEDRAVPGHWEGDLLCGTSSSQIATLVERHSRYTVLVRLPSKDTTTVVDALVQRVRELPAHLVSSLTWDRGGELAQHKRFTVATDVQVYFCDPHSPWQRGSNENTNGLLRQYFPKGTDISGYTQDQLDAVAYQLNTRPRKTLGFHTPADTFAAWVLR